MVYIDFDPFHDIFYQGGVEGSNINISMQIWDFPGQIDFFDPAFDSELIFGNCGALVFVIDAQVCF